MKRIYMTSCLRYQGRVAIVHQPVPGCTLPKDREAFYSDAYIEHWGRVFKKMDLYHRRGILFETFLMAPEEILAAVRALPVDSAPLLARQAQAMQHTLQQEAVAPYAPQNSSIAAMVERAEAELDRMPAELRGDRYVEPLRHYAFTTSRVSIRRASA